VSVTYEGSATAPTEIGSYAVVASLSNANYTAVDKTGTLVINKATTTLTLSNLTHHYDGLPKSATATTNPAGLNAVSITYNGSSTVPTNAGSYTVVASLNNALYTAPPATGTLVIDMTSQTITFDPLPNRPLSDSWFNLSATASSGLTVTYTSLTTSKCTVTNKKVTLVATGTCTIRASQAGSSNYYA